MCVPSLLAPQNPHCSGRELFLQCACDVRTVLAHAVKCGGSRGASPPWFQDVVLRWAWLSVPPMERKDEVRARPTSLCTHISCCVNLTVSQFSPLSPYPPCPAPSLQPSPLLLASVCAVQSIVQMTSQTELGRVVQVVCQDLFKLDQTSHHLMLKAAVHQSCSVRLCM